MMIHVVECRHNIALNGNVASLRVCLYFLNRSPTRLIRSESVVVTLVVSSFAKRFEYRLVSSFEYRSYDFLNNPIRLSRNIYRSLVFLPGLGTQVRLAFLNWYVPFLICFAIFFAQVNPKYLITPSSL